MRWYRPDEAKKYPKVVLNPARLKTSIADEHAIETGYYFDERSAKRAINFFERYLRHSKGRWAGKPFLLMDWQKYEVIAPLFGWKRKDGTRRFRLAYIEVPKKNGKSGLCSGIALYLLCADGEQGAEVYSAAADHKQAGIVFNESARMVRKSLDLRKRLRIKPSTKTIYYARKSSIYQALSADVETKEGYDISGLVFDELHAQKKRALWDTLRYAGAAREQPLFVSITTAGFDRQSVCWEQHEYARKILKGQVLDPSFFALIYSTNWEDAEARNTDEEEMDWRSEDAWKTANPSLGETIKLEDFRQECLEAQESPLKENAFKRYRLNIWTRAETRWFAIDKWKACGGAFDLELLKGRRCFGGLDMASVDDLASFSLVFEPGEDRLLYFLNWSWCPMENLWKRVKKNRVPYDHWMKRGYLIGTEGNAIDETAILKKIFEIKDVFPSLELIGFDRWGAMNVTHTIEEGGIDVVPVGQGFASMSAPSKTLERAVLDEVLRHGDNPVLSWAADNVVISSDPAGNIKPVKDKSTEKIDPVVALVMAIAAMQQAKENEESIYRSRGIVVL
ncbi:terminase large subunit [Dethiosulfovibrio sp. F2B]|uniref:terminase large subunit n=1 Tax=Dethiosulfovibrio faecalis TaxID=2720018 RepID=UPI001F15CA91|nr:terminase TerL endonuclease subunit [Dethiosulfovibrio faecalis]MCF4152608.1 terminase large subunit [Dethiosulfovibrio faecalis]